MEYTVLESDSLVQLSADVEDYIARGWEPQGGIAIATAYDEGRRKDCYAQALVKKDGEQS